MSADDAAVPNLRQCSHPDCCTWRSRPCGEGCHWSPTDPTQKDLNGTSELSRLRAENERLRAERLKLDRRIHNQRRAWRETWETIEMRARWISPARTARERYWVLHHGHKQENARLRAEKAELVEALIKIAQTDYESSGAPGATVARSGVCGRIASAALSKVRSP